MFKTILLIIFIAIFLLAKICLIIDKVIEKFFNTENVGPIGGLSYQGFFYKIIVQDSRGMQ